MQQGEGSGKPIHLGTVRGQTCGGRGDKEEMQQGEGSEGTLLPCRKPRLGAAECPFIMPHTSNRSRQRAEHTTSVLQPRMQQQGRQQRRPRCGQQGALAWCSRAASSGTNSGWEDITATATSASGKAKEWRRVTCRGRLHAAGRHHTELGARGRMHAAGRGLMMHGEDPGRGSMQWGEVERSRGAGRGVTQWGEVR